MTQPQIAAFFDLDDTILVKTNSLYLYVKYLVQQKQLSKWELLKGAWLSALHKLHLVNIEKLLDEMAKPYKGKRHSELKAMTDAWFENTVTPHISKEAVERIAWHKKQGHKVVLLSTATQYVCGPARKKLNLDDSINSTVHIKDDLLLGTLQKPLCYQEGKVHYTNLYAQKHLIDLSQSYFYTDSISDLPMLKHVGIPVVVNPDPLLGRQAKKQGWPIEHWTTKASS